ncbi:MAG: membrane protein [Methylocystaceae bacterium]|nr:MAG: membrane protein [Methylocystaceae bacterium]
MSRFFALKRGSLISLALATLLALAPAIAEARMGGGGSFGSRGGRSWSAPPSTRTMPGQASPFERSVAPRPAPGMAGPMSQPGGLFGGSLGRGLLGGLAGGLLGAGLFGLLTGHGLFGGMGGFMSIIGLLLQIGLIVFLARMAFNWWTRRNANANAMAGAGHRPSRLLGESQAAYSREDLGALRGMSTPEMASYFDDELEENRRKGVINRVSDVKLLQGDLSEAWREGVDEYATVAMRFALNDVIEDRATGKPAPGSPGPTETSEAWTFRRPAGAGPQEWKLSAIQQAA